MKSRQEKWMDEKRNAERQVGDVSGEGDELSNGGKGSERASYTYNPGLYEKERLSICHVFLCLFDTRLKVFCIMN